MGSRCRGWGDEIHATEDVYICEGRRCIGLQCPESSQKGPAGYGMRAPRATLGARWWDKKKSSRREGSGTRESDLMGPLTRIAPISEDGGTR